MAIILDNFLPSGRARRLTVPLYLHHLERVSAQEIENGETVLTILLGDSHREEAPFELIEVLLQNGADVEIQNKNGETPLHLCRTKAIASLLLSLGADIDARDKSGDTPLMRVLQRSNPIELLEVLLDKGATVHINNNEGYTALYYCNAKKKVDLHLRHGADFEARTERGETVLSYILKLAKMSPGFLEFSFEKGARIQDKNNFALHSCSKEIASILVRHGADLTADQSRFSV